MELKDYISETISNVILGIKDAQEKIKESGGMINPRIAEYGTGETKPLAEGDNPIEDIEFETALILEETKGSNAKINVFSGIFGGGVEGESSKMNQSINKIKFKIPIAYPQQR